MGKMTCFHWPVFTCFTGFLMENLHMRWLFLNEKEKMEETKENGRTLRYKDTIAMLM